MNERPAGDNGTNNTNNDQPEESAGPIGDAGLPAALEVGVVAKPHGLRGEVIVSLWTNVSSRLSPGSRLLSDQGELVVVASRPHQERHLVVFEGIETRADAESLRGLVLRADALSDESSDTSSDDALWVHELIGAAMVATDGRHLGIIEAVEANPASDLLVLGDGSLVPLCFVVEHRRGRDVVVDVPDGLVPPRPTS